MSRSWRDSILNVFLPSPSKSLNENQEISDKNIEKLTKEISLSEGKETEKKEKQEYRIECTLNSESFLPGSVISCKIDVENISKLTSNPLNSSQGDSGDSSEPSSLPISTENNGIEVSNGEKEEKKMNGINWICVCVFGNVSWDEKWFRNAKISSSSSEENYRTPLTPRFMHDPRYKLHLDQLPESYLPIIDPSHSIGDKSEMIFSTPLYFLTGFVPINPQEQKSYVFQCNLPYNLPPTYKGTSLRYKYAVSVSVQPFNELLVGEEAPIGTLQIPFRVLNPISALKQTILSKEGGEANYNIVSRELEIKKKGEARSIHNSSILPIPAVRNGQFGPNHLQLLSEHDFNHHMKMVKILAQDNCRPVNMTIQKGNNQITKLTLNKTAFELGDLVKGIFDFSEASERSRCCQVSVRLETEEKLETLVANPKRSSPIYKIVSEFHHPTQNSKNCSFMFQIPNDGSQEFETELVSVKWRIRFEFITSNPHNNASLDNDILLSPNIGVQSLTWILPIRVLVPNLPSESIYKSPGLILC